MDVHVANTILDRRLYDCQLGALLATDVTQHVGVTPLDDLAGIGQYEDSAVIRHDINSLSRAEIQTSLQSCRKRV